jgi:hypothetical protein
MRLRCAFEIRIVEEVHLGSREAEHGDRMGFVVERCLTDAENDPWLDDDITESRDLIGGLEPHPRLIGDGIEQLVDAKEPSCDAADPAHRIERRLHLPQMIEERPRTR